MKTKLLKLSTLALAVATLFGSNLVLAATADDVVCTQCVDASDIALGAIIQGRIANGAVTSAKLAAQSVTGGKIANGSIAENKIQAGAVSTSKIRDGSVSNAKLTAGAVTTNNIITGAVTGGKIANGAVTTGKIANGAVSEAKLDAAVQTKLNTVGTIADGSVTSAKIATGAVTSTKIATGAVTNTKIGSRSVTGNKLAIGAASVSHVAFVNENTSTSNASTCILSRNSTYAHYLAGGGVSSSCDAFAPIQIPDGVTITGLNCTFYDNNGTNSLNASLRRVDTVGGVQVIASTPSTVNSTSVQTVSKSASAFTPLPNNLVDNNAYSYNIFVSYSASDFTTLSTNARIYRCEVRYNQIFKIILPL